MELDKSLMSTITKDLERLEDEIKLNDVNTKLKYKNLFASDWSIHKYENSHIYFVNVIDAMLTKNTIYHY